MWNQVENVRLIAARLSAGDTTNELLCPWCGGGASAEKNFYITRFPLGQVKYICHRASCGESGGTFVDGYARDGITVLPHSDRPRSTVPFSPTPVPFSLYSITAHEAEVIKERYGIDMETIRRARWSTFITSTGYSIPPLAMPVLSPTGLTRGWMTKERPKDGKKISKSWKVVDEPWVSWLGLDSPANHVVVCEDQISQARVSKHCGAIALLGTLLTPNKASEIAEYSKGKLVYICLDKDATHKAVEYVRKYRLTIPNFKCIFLSKDIKDLSPEEFTIFINDLNVEVSI